jgi:predicted dehydrogenase
MMDPTRIGVIGVGRMGQNHCRVYSTLRLGVLVGVYDLDEEVCQKVASTYMVAGFETLDQILASVDAVSIVTPTPTHYGLIEQALNHGVHVLVEKPIAENSAQAEKICQMAEASGQIVQVGHIERFNPTYRELKHLLEHMHVLAIDINRLSPFEGSNTDVDVVFDLFVHDADLLLDLIGRAPVTLHASGVSALSGVLDYVVAQLVFDNGPIVTATASRVTEEKIRRIDVTALEAYIEADLLNKSLFVNRRTIGEYINVNQSGVKYRQESIVERIHVPILEPLYLESSHFLESVKGDKECLVTARDGLNALRLVETIREKALENLIISPVEVAPMASTTAEHIRTN